MEARTPAVAVITRTKNRPLLLERAIKSVLNQSFNDFIMVIVNDGGEQKSLNRLVKKYLAQSEGRIQLLHNPKSLGMEVASNIGIKNSKSKYVALLDDDDSWHEDFLRETVGYLNETGNKGVVTASEIVHETIRGNSMHENSRARFMPEIKNINLFTLAGRNIFPVNTFVYAREVFKKIGYYDENMKVVGDWDFNIRFIQRYNIGFINKPLAYYHQRTDTEGQIANSIVADNTEHWQAINYVLNKYMRADLDSGKIGMGLITNLSHNFSSLMQRQDNLTQAHINNLTNIIKNLEHQLNNHKGSKPWTRLIKVKRRIKS